MFQQQQDKESFVDLATAVLDHTSGKLQCGDSSRCNPTNSASNGAISHAPKLLERLVDLQIQS